MALVNCPECKKTISNQAEFCINCGFPINAESPQNFSSKKMPVKLKVTVWIIIASSVCGLAVYLIFTMNILNSKKQFERKTFYKQNGKEVCKVESYISIKMTNGLYQDFLNGKYEEYIDNSAKQPLLIGYYQYDSIEQRSCKTGEWLKYDENGTLIDKTLYDKAYSCVYPIETHSFYNSGKPKMSIAFNKDKSLSISILWSKAFYPNGQLKYNFFYDDINGVKTPVILNYDQAGIETNENGRKYWSVLELDQKLREAKPEYVEELLGKPDNKYERGVDGAIFYCYKNLIKSNNQMHNCWVYFRSALTQGTTGSVQLVSIQPPYGLSN